MSAMRCSECGVEVKTDPHVCPKPQREFVARIMLIGLEPFTTQAAVLQAASPLWQHYEDHAATVAALEGRNEEMRRQFVSALEHAVRSGYRLPPFVLATLDRFCALAPRAGEGAGDE